MSYIKINNYSNSINVFESGDKARFRYKMESMDNIEQEIKEGFDDLGPNRVLGLVENRLGVRCSNLFRPLNSYINRVYELEQEDGTGLIVKFYRPGRWSENAILDEHTYLQDLAKQEIGKRISKGIVTQKMFSDHDIEPGDLFWYIEITRIHSDDSCPQLVDTPYNILENRYTQEE